MFDPLASGITDTSDPLCLKESSYKPSVATHAGLLREHVTDSNSPHGLPVYELHEPQFDSNSPSQDPLPEDNLLGSSPFPVDSLPANVETSDASGSPEDELTGLLGDAPSEEQAVRRAIRAGQSVREQLSTTDPLNPTLAGRFRDDYLLTGNAGDQVQINLNSAQFNTYLQVVDANTGRVLAADNDSGAGTNAQLTFTLRSGVTHIIRATSITLKATGNYTLSVFALPPVAQPPVSQAPPQQPITTPPPTSETGTASQFSSTFGYGLVDASGAVAKAVNSARFEAVPNQGGLQVGNDMVRAPEAWAKGYTGQNVVVAVIDGGVDFTHPDLNDNIWINTREVEGNGVDDDGNGFIDDVRGWNFAGSNNDTLDRRGHGTHVAGIIAAENNSVGVTGTAYNAKIMPVKVLADDGTGNTDNVALGIRYATNNGADVINLSLGSSSPNETIASAIQYATSLGVVVVMAAGNSGTAEPIYPARYATNIGISVGAVDSAGAIASFSNRAGTDSRLQHVVAPGVAVYSTINGGSYGYSSGTSMASPYISGVVALMLSANPNLTPAQVRQMITSTAVNPTAA